MRKVDASLTTKDIAFRVSTTADSMNAQSRKAVERRVDFSLLQALSEELGAMRAFCCGNPARILAF